MTIETDRVAWRRKAQLTTVQVAQRYLFPHWSLWVPLVILFAVNMAWIFLSPRFRLSGQGMMLVSLVLIGCPVALLYGHLRSHAFDQLLARLYSILMASIFTAFLTQQFNIFNHLTMSLGMPLADDWLNGWDRALGFDWNAYAVMVATHPWIRGILAFAYGPFIGIAFAALVAVPVWLGRYDRVNEVAFLALASAFICIGLAAFFPAEAAWNTIATVETKSAFGEPLGLFWLDQFRALRGEDPVILDLRTMQGLATFPSYHACLGLIIFWCSRGHWLSFLAGSTGGLAVLAATPVFGWHYAVDLLASGFVMAAAVLLWRRIAPETAGRGDTP
jgi:hypothetical protein